MIELEPIYDPHKSFYNKAYVDNPHDEVYDLYSYDTLVCTINLNEEPTLFIYGDTWWDSVTTLRHIREFIHQYNPNITMFSKNYLKKYVI